MKTLSTTELTQLGRAARRGSQLGRAVAELKQRRTADILTPTKLRSLQAVRALVAEHDGDHAAELAVLDDLLAAHGALPDIPTKDHDDAEQDPEQDPAPTGRRRIQWPFGH